MVNVVVAVLLHRRCVFKEVRKSQFGTDGITSLSQLDRIDNPKSDENIDPIIGYFSDGYILLVLKIIIDMYLKVNGK